MEKVRKFLASGYVNIIWFALAAIIVCIDQILAPFITPQFPVFYGLCIFYGMLIFIVLMLTDDIISILCPVLLLFSFAVQYKDSYDGFIVYLPLAPFVVFSILYHIFAYKKKFKPKNITKLRLFWPLVATSIATVLGGVGIMTFAEYTTKINITYMILLGPAALLVYWLFSCLVNRDVDHYSDPELMDERLSKILILVSSFIVFAVFEYYVENWSEFVSNPTILQFQWRNNACTFLMLFMPFSFYMAKKKNFAYIIVAFAAYVAMLLSGSRGGLLFGTIEIVILIIYYAIVDKKHRKILLTIVGVALAALVCLIPKLTSLLSSTLERFTSYKENFRRLGLIQRSFVDFKANPLFGRGIGYMGNRDLHPSKIGQLCWYHSSIPQVIGSFGIVGILAYGYSLIERLKFLLKNGGEFKRTVFFSFGALELMSLVNPGIFAPAFLAIIIVFFTFAEQYDN